MSLEKQFLPIVLQGMDTKTDDKNTATGQLLLAKNLVMDKTKKWSNRNGYIKHSDDTFSNAVLLSIDNAAPLVLSSNKIYNIGSVASKTTDIDRGVYTCSDFIQAPGDGCIFASTTDPGSFLVYSWAGVSARYDNYQLQYVETALGSGVDEYTTDEAGNVYSLVNSGANLRIRQFTSTGMTTKTIATGDNPFRPKVAALFTGGKSYVCAFYIDLNTFTRYVYIWNATDDTVTSKITVHSTASTHAQPSVGAITGNKFRVASGASATSWNTYDVSIVGAVSSVATVTANVNITPTLTRVNFDGGVDYNGTTTGVTATGRDICFVSGVVYPDRKFVGIPKLVASAPYLLENIGLKSAIPTLNPSYNNLQLFVDGKMFFGMNFGYSHFDNTGLNYPTNFFKSASDIGIYSKGINRGCTFLSTSQLPTLARFSGQNYTNAAGNIGLVEFSSNPFVTLFYGSGPEVAAATNNAAGGTFQAGTYQMFTSYEYTDSQGKVYYSAAGPILTKSINANDSLTVAIYNWTSGSSAIPSVQPDNNVLWATEPGGTTFYRVGNVWSAATFGLVATYTRFSYAGVPWPFQGGLLEPGGTPASGAVAVSQNRLWGSYINSDDSWFFSSKVEQNFGPFFPSEFLYRTDSAHGRPVVAAEMDNKTILFHEYGIFMTYGDGPDNTGANPFPSPVLITTSLGCKFARSVVLTDAGLMFMSHEGIWLLSRGLELLYVGKDVEDYNTLTITAAATLVDRHQVWFASSEGTALVYDDFHKLWSVFTGQPTKAFALNGSTPWFVRSSDNKLLKESAAAYDDAGTAFDCQLKTGWISLAGVQGFKRMYKMAFTGSATDAATMDLYRDWSVASYETFSIAAAKQGQWEALPKVQKVEALQFSLTWPAITGPLSLSAFGVVAGLKAGSFRVTPSTNRIKGA
jgi:hypothetical protein